MTYLSNVDCGSYAQTISVRSPVSRASIDTHGESIDFRTLAGHPPRSPGCIEIVSYFDGRMAGAHPFFEATFQKRRGVSHRAQFISDGTAHFTARPAVDRERTRSGQRSCPLTDMVRTAAKRARNETRLLEIVILVAHVDHDG